MTIDLHQPLKDALEDYQLLKIDSNTEKLLWEIKGLVKGGVINSVLIPKTLSMLYWIKALWGAEDETVVDCYHKRKADGEPYNTDFSSFGNAPHTYYEIEEEYDFAILQKDIASINKELASGKISIDDLTLSYYLAKCIETNTPIAGVNCAVETEVADLEKEFEDGVTYGEKFPYQESLNGEKVIIRIIDVHQNDKKSWFPQYTTWETIKKAHVDFGSVILTNQITLRLNSPDYREQSGV